MVLCTSLQIFVSFLTHNHLVPFWQTMIWCLLTDKQLVQFWLTNNWSIFDWQTFGPFLSDKYLIHFFWQTFSPFLTDSLLIPFRLTVFLSLLLVYVQLEHWWKNAKIPASAFVTLKLDYRNTFTYCLPKIVRITNDN